MASTSSDLLQEQLCKLHRRLITDIASNIASKSREGQNFLFHIKEILKDRIYESHDSVPDKIKALEKKNVFGLENYEGLKEICNDSGNLNLIKIIKTCEDNMATIRSKYQHNESSKSSKEEDEGNKRKLINIEPEQKKEKHRLRLEDSDEQKQQAYEKAKLGWRNKMIQEYHKTVLKVPAMPLLPRETCEFSQIYVRPTIVTKVKDEKGETKEKVIESMSEIFTKDGVPLKSIYVVGDAGTGKSSFCKYLVNCWCMAHSEGQIVEDKFNGINEMKKFDFLFLISLRHNQKIDDIHEMLKNQYDIDILGTLLEKESAKMIILLDGLDEWSPKGETFSQFQTMGLPKRNIYKDYTIVTTSRSWKICTLKVSDTEIQQMLKLKGFDYDSESEMVSKTVFQYNASRHASKMASECLQMLEEESVENLKQIPLMLQQVICLWLDGKLDKTSRCAIYTGMLELFFTWNENRSTGKNTLSPMKVDLPRHLAKKRQCKSNSRIIYDMSQLAYETLFKCPKDESLAFDICVFEELEISDETRENCLKLGILTEDKCPSLFVSEPPRSMFSFLHKSVQEFLAAVNISINFKTKINSSVRLKKEDLEEVGKQFVNDIFQNCSTVNEILEQSNVIISLSGLEHSLASHVSKYIYDIVKEDQLVQRYRRTIDSVIRLYDSDCSFIKDIQTLIFDSMKECLVESNPTFYIGDLYIDYSHENCGIVCSSFDRKQITPDIIHSINVEEINRSNVKFSKYLTNFKHLEKIQIEYDQLGSSNTENADKVNKSVAETIKLNASTLQSLSLSYDGYTYNTDKSKLLCKDVVCILYRMINLVAIIMTKITMSHDDTTKFCKFLEETSKLEQIHINIKCECRNRHDVDLSKHQQLQYLDLSGCTCVCVTDINTVNLEIFKCWNIKSNNYIKIFDCIKKCGKLKELGLHVDGNNRSQSFHTSMTKKLVSVLPLLHNLSMLMLFHFRLTYNIIQVLSKMESLKLIDFSSVIMSLTTWRTFVDSLPSILHTVDVKLYGCYMTGNDEEINVDRLPSLEGGGKMNEAIQYVKDSKQLFIVKYDDFSSFQFSTK